jgi:hypothetical protein
MKIDKLLTVAGLSGYDKLSATACLLEAKDRTTGLLLHKLHARLLMAGKIAKALPWEAERLLTYRPGLSAFDIEVAKNITCNGDGADWDEATKLPYEGHYLNPDPESDDYKAAVAACYWAKGHHPRSYEARKAWYLRNAGAYRAYELGQKVDIKGDGVNTWKGRDGNLTVNVYQCGTAWQINATRKIIGRLAVKTRIGYEITNVWNEANNLQAWYPIPGYDLKAPVTWSILPSRSGSK